VEQVVFLTDQMSELAFVGRGYRGHGVETTQVLISGSKRGLTPTLKKLLQTRSAIEPEIGHMTTDGRLARCTLKGLRGNAIFAVVYGCGHNLRKILNHIGKLLVVIATVLPANVFIRAKNMRRVRIAMA
jgi:transposase, IS5 family